MKQETIVTSKGQVTIPKKIRERFGLTQGTKILFSEQYGELKLVPKIQNPREELRNLRKELEKEGKLFTREELDAMMAESRNAWDRFS